MKSSKKILIIDANSIIHRAYHALPPLKKKDGKIVNAVYGFFSVLIKNTKDFNPSHIITAFDLPEKTFRHKKFKEYKAKRPATEKDLIPQFFLIKQGLSSLGVPVFEKPGFEADDIIGTISEIISMSSDQDIVVLTGDKDSFQLISPKTKICFLKKGIKNIEIYDTSRINEIYDGLMPSQMIDFNSLKGDPSDNIPGVPGIGPKTALSLVKEFDSLDVLYQNVKRGSKKIKESVLEKLIRGEKSAFLSRDLVTIKKDIDLGFCLNDCVWGGWNEEKIEPFFVEMGFDSLLKRIKNQETEKSKVVSKENLSLF